MFVCLTFILSRFEKLKSKTEAVAANRSYFLHLQKHSYAFKANPFFDFNGIMTHTQIYCKHCVLLKLCVIFKMKGSFVVLTMQQSITWFKSELIQHFYVCLRNWTNFIWVLIYLLVIDNIVSSLAFLKHFALKHIQYRDSIMPFVKPHKKYSLCNTFKRDLLLFFLLNNLRHICTGNT